MAERRAAGQALAAVVGLSSAVLAGWLALHHPLSPTLAMAGVVVLAAAQAAWPPLWLIALPALLPWLGLGAWTGWLVAEEMDLAILAVAAGAYLRWAVRPGPRVRASRASRHARQWGRPLWLLWTASVLVALQLGVADAGGWRWGWWQGVREPLNALRMAKPTLAVLLLLPLWWRLQQRPGQRSADQLAWGMAAMLAGISLWCAYERMAYTGLLNMATDHRTTGPFWETQFGGAALDLSLALTLPFALHLAWTARRPLAVAGAGLVLLGGVYAGLTSFSRIVYLALPLGALLLWLAQRGQPGPGSSAKDTTAANTAVRPDRAAGGRLVMLTLGLAGLCAWLFPTAGYRGLLALLGNGVILLWLVPRSIGQPKVAWISAWTGGLVLTALLAPGALAWSKGAYLAFTVSSLVAAAALWRLDSGAHGRAGGPADGQMGTWILAGAGFVAQLASTVLVGWNWGGAATLPAAAGASGLAALAWLILGQRQASPWNAGVGTVMRATPAMAAAMAVVAVFSAGAFMSDRLQHTESDGAERWQHWREGLALNSGGAAWWLGEGLGRYPDLYLLRAPLAKRPGDIRLVPGADPAGGHSSDGPHMRLVAGNHMLGRGELLRLSQRVPLDVPASGLRLALQLRAEAPADLQVELCRKHLLYDGTCRAATVRSKPGQPGWQVLELALPDAEPDADGLPRINVFSVASGTRLPVDVRSIRLTDTSGRQWLQNPDFADGSARWFSTSDRNHLPWHAKNLVVHLLVEQGLLGLVALLALTLAALAAVWGPMRRHPLAPALGAAIVGAWVVGSVDSLLDMPRVATWLLLLTGMALRLHLPSHAGGGRDRHDAAASADRHGQQDQADARTSGRSRGARRTALAGNTRPPRRVVRTLLLGLPIAALLGLGALVAASTQGGYTPAELLAFAELQLRETPLLDQTAAPLLASLGQAFAVQAAGGTPVPYAVPPLPANPAAAAAGGPAGAGATPDAAPPAPATGRRLQVGPTRALRSVAAAAAQARDGDTVEIDPGDYQADVAVWTQNDLVIRGMGQRVRLIANGASAEGKAIWVLRGGRITVEGIDFIGARVADRNGAGIRFEQGHLTVRHCLFFDNENGILASPNPASVLEVVQSEFAYNGAGDGQSHHLYANRIRQLTVTGSWFHHANVGHLLKSRAIRSLVAYNRLTDEPGGRASYELEFPNGGAVVVLGNLIQQGPQTSNSAIVSYGAENLAPATEHRLQMAFNTVINGHPHGGTFVRAMPGAELVLLLDNLWIGRGVLDVPRHAVQQRNLRLALSDMAQPDLLDGRLGAAVRARLPATPLAEIDADLLPRQAYHHPVGLRPVDGPTRGPGALQSPAP